MAFKTRRQRRYDILRIAGFLPFEARELSRVPFKVPYMDVLIKERYKRFQEVTRAKWSWAGYERLIRAEYRDKNWQRQARAGRVRDDVWAMLRAFEHAYRAKHPDYESPWQKRRRGWRKFLRQVEDEYLKYPKRMPRVRIRYKPEGGAEIVK